VRFDLDNNNDDGHGGHIVALFLRRDGSS